MKLRVMLSLLLIPLAPQAGLAQQPLVRMPPRLGAHTKFESPTRPAPTHTPAADTARSAFKRNVIRGAAVGAVIGGVIGAFASEHQAVGVGFTHTPAVLFIATYGGLGALLGLIAGTLLPGG